MWNEFRLSSNVEATINNTLCTNGLFHIASTEEALKKPTVQAAVLNDNIFVAVDQSIVLLENDNMGECKFLSFEETKIDCVFISDSGKLVVCCLLNGIISGFSITGSPLFNLRVDQEDIGENRTFVGISSSLQDIYIMCVNGRIYKIKSVDQDKSVSGIHCNETLLLNETVTSNAHISKISSRKFYNEIISFIIIPQMDLDNPTIVFNDCNQIYIYSVGDILSTSPPTTTNGIKKLHIFNNYLLGLCHNGYIVEICPFTGMIYNKICESDYQIDDFVFLESFEDKFELMILTNANKMGQKTLKIVEFPSMQSMYELNMDEHIWLVEQSRSSMGMFYLLGNIVGDESIPQEIEMKIISEALPLHKLKKMICSGRLDEAEHFAIQFNLSLQPIYECRVNRQVASICECRNTEDLRRLLSDFLLLLDNVADDANILLHLWCIEIPDRQLTAEFLRYLFTRLSGEDDTRVEMRRKIAEQLRRIETLHLIDPADSMLEWRKFINSHNLVKICMEYLSSSVSHACLIWSRHSSHIIPNLDINDLMNILNSLPNTVEPMSIIQWMQHFTPSLLQIHPQFMPVIVDWSINKMRYNRNNFDWTDNTLEIFNGVLDIFLNLHFIIADPRRQYDSSIQKLQSIKFALDEIQVLERDYKLAIDFNDYISNSLEETTFKLLVGVQTQNIQSLIVEFIYPIFMEKHKSPIDSLVNYINFLILYRKSFCYWQDRAVSVVELIPDEDERLCCAQNVLMVAPVPWSPVLAPLIKYSSLNHPLAQEIRSLNEQQIVKIIKQKYHWPQNAQNDYLMLMCRILREKLPDMCSDINNLIKAVPEIEKHAYYCYIHELAKMAKFEMAIEILEKLDNNRQEIVQYLMEIFINMLKDGVEQSMEENFIQILNILNNKSNNMSDARVQEINLLHLLKKRFENQFSSHTVNELTASREIFTKGLDIITNNLRNYGDHLLQRLWGDVKIITQCLNIDFLDGLIELAFKCSNLYLSCAIAYNILSMIEISGDNCERILRFCSLLLVQQAQTFETDQYVGKDPQTFAIVYKFLVRVLQVTKIYYMEAMDMIVWVRIVNEYYSESAIEEYYHSRSHELNREIIQILVNDHTTMHNLKNNRKKESMSIFELALSPAVQEVNEVKQDLQSVIKCISTIMKIIHHFPEGAKFGYRLKEFITHKDEISMEDENSLDERLKLELSDTVEKLYKLKMYSTVYMIALRIIELQKKCGVQFIPKNSVDILHQKFIKSALSEKDFNLMECLSHLICGKSQEKFLHSIQIDCKSDTFKLNYHTLMEQYYNFSGHLDKTIHHRESRIKYEFIQEIRKKNPDFEINCALENITLTQMISEVCTVPIDLTSLQKLCKNFSWEGDYQELLISQLLVVLNQQEMKFKVTTDALGREMLIVENCVKDILKQCRPYMTEIVKEKLLTKKLVNYMNTSVNFYFYEMYLSIIEILTEFNALPSDMGMWKHILEFFKHKMTVKRRTRPMRKEIDAWLNTKSEGGLLPSISKYRFPFHVIIKNDLHDTLSDEIFVENCEEWFPLINMHAMNFYKEVTKEMLMEITEKFCMTAIRNSISEHKDMTETNENELEMKLRPSDNSLLKAILKLTKFMTTEWKIFSVLYYVTNYAAGGVDHVEAAYECYKYAIENEKAIMMSDKGRDQLMKIKRKYPMIKIQHLLQVHKLNQENLLNLMDNPLKLIHALYMHDSILTPQPPNINHVIEEVAELHALDLRVVQVNLLTKWLFSSINSNETCSDDTLLLDNLHENTLKEDKYLSQDTYMDDYVKRAQYILSSWPVDETVKYLIAISHQNSQNSESQLKIYEWVIRLLDDDKVEMKAIIEHKNYVQLKVINDLKKLGFNLSSSKYHSYDKIDLLKKIWQNHDNNPIAVHAMALICLEFDINETKIWDVILKRMVQFSMRKELLSIVNFLSSKQDLLILDNLQVAWEFLIREPFEKATQPRVSQDNDELYRALCVLQTCPITHKINFVKLAEICEHIDRMHMAAILMMFAKKGDRAAIKDLVMKYKSQKMKDDLQELELHGILPILIKNATIEIFHNLDD